MVWLIRNHRVRIELLLDPEEAVVVGAAVHLAQRLRIEGLSRREEVHPGLRLH